VRKNPDHEAKGADECQSYDQFPLLIPGSDAAKVPAPRDCDGDRAGYDSSPSSKWVKNIYVNRISIGKSKSLAAVIRGHELGLPITSDANFLNIPDASAGGYERSVKLCENL
jgi:hypothetical protein